MGLLSDVARRCAEGKAATNWRIVHVSGISAGVLLGGGRIQFAAIGPDERQYLAFTFAIGGLAIPIDAFGSNLPRVIPAERVPISGIVYCSPTVPRTVREFVPHVPYGRRFRALRKDDKVALMMDDFIGAGKVYVVSNLLIFCLGMDASSFIASNLTSGVVPFSAYLAMRGCRVLCAVNLPEFMTQAFMAAGVATSMDISPASIE